MQCCMQCCGRLVPDQETSLDACASEPVAADPYCMLDKGSRLLLHGGHKVSQARFHALEGLRGLLAVYTEISTASVGLCRTLTVLYFCL